MIPDYLKSDVLCFDVETAILGDKVIEIGFSLFRNLELIHEWGAFVNPHIAIDPEASKVHKIYDRDVMDAPSFKDIGWIIHNNLYAADIFVAYNFEYDRKVLGTEFSRVNISWPVKPVIDPFIFFKQWNKYHKGKRLINATEAYGIEYLGAHRAVNDATATGKLLFKMAAIKPNFPKTINDLMKKQRQWIELQYKDFSKYRASKGLDPIDKPNYTFYEEPL